MIDLIRSKLLVIAEQMPNIWCDLSKQGVLLPELMCTEIDESRERDESELSYKYYLCEKLKELFGCYGANINNCTSYRELRKLSIYRSSYLDWLQNRVDSGVYPFLEKYPNYTRLHLDPSYTYSSTFCFRASHKDCLRKFEAYNVQKEKEIIHFKDRIATLSSLPIKTSPSRIFKLLDDIFASIGFDVFNRNLKKGEFIFSTKIDEYCDLYIIYDDHYGMVKGGSWSLRFYLLPSSVDATNIMNDNNSVLDKYKFPVMENLLPGYNWYCKHDARWDFIVLGALIVSIFFEMFISKWRTFCI